MRQTSLRNQRSKGLRARHIIQLCVLTAVCMWLLYQLKHSYDKRRVMNEQDAKISQRVSDGGIDIFKLGRKDLPHLEEIHRKEDEHGEVEEEEEEHETKEEPKDEELRGVGDDEMDGAEEQDQEKDGGEGEHDEESATEEEKDAQVEGKDLLDGEEHEGNSQEAREEHYKKDDASSAVHHDTHTAETEGGNEERVENKESDGEMETEAKEKVDLNGEMETEAKEKVDLNGEMETDTNEKVDLSKNSTFVENGTLMGNGSLSNSTLGEHESQTELNPNTSALTNSSNQMELKTGTTDLPTDQIQTQNSTIALDRNSTLDTGTTEEDKPNMAGALIKFTEKSNTSNNGEGGEGGSSNPSQTEESNTGVDSDTAQRKSSGPSQTENTNTSENGDAAQGEHVDPSHDTVTSEEKEAHTDPSTLSSIQTKAKNGENKAAE